MEPECFKKKPLQIINQDLQRNTQEIHCIQQWLLLPPVLAVLAVLRVIVGWGNYGRTDSSTCWTDDPHHTTMDGDKDNAYRSKWCHSEDRPCSMTHWACDDYTIGIASPGPAQSDLQRHLMAAPATTAFRVSHPNHPKAGQSAASYTLPMNIAAAVAKFIVVCNWIWIWDVFLCTLHRMSKRCFPVEEESYAVVHSGAFTFGELIYFRVWEV